jgi:hypothetical protein
VLLANKGYGDDEIAFILRRSTPLVAAYRRLAEQFGEKRTAGARFREILERVEKAVRPGKNACFGEKKGGTPR